MLSLEEKKELERQRRIAAKRIGFADSMAFNGFIGVVIVLNLIFIGIEQDFGVKEDPNLNAYDNMLRRLRPWYAIEFVFTLIFVIELVIKLRAFGMKYFMDPWNIMDFVLVVLAVVDTWILTFVDTGGNKGDLKMLSTLRVVRMLRLVRFVRLLRQFQELWLLVAGLMNSMRTLAWVALLLMIVLYVFGIFLTMFVGQNPAYADVETADKKKWPYLIYFGKVPNSMLTLFQVATLDSWADDIARPVMKKNEMMGIFFVGFVLFATFGILNIVVGVIVENTLGTANATDKVVAAERTAKKRKVLESLKKLFELTDADKSGTLSREELGAALTIPEVADKFASLGLPMMDVNLMFDLMDPGGDGNISLDDFMSACTQLLGEMGQKDIMQLAMQVESLGRRMELMDTALRNIEQDSEETKALTLRFMKTVAPKLVGNALDSQN